MLREYPDVLVLVGGFEAVANVVVVVVVVAAVAIVVSFECVAQ